MIQSKKIDLAKISLISASNGQTVDIRDIVLSVSIFEDILKPTITANILVAASIPLHEALPFTGSDILSLSFKSSDRKKYINLSLVAYSISNAVKKDNKYVYTIRAASAEYIQSHKSKISKSFKGDYSKVVSTIFNGMGTGKKISTTNPSKNNAHIKTKYQNQVLIPNWKPFDAIQFFANRSVDAGSSSGAADFLFYEGINADGNGSSYYYRTYESLVDPNRKFATGENYAKIYRSIEVRALDPSSRSNAQLAKDAVETYVLISSQNLLDDLERGTLAGRTLSFDITNKRYIKTDNSYYEQFNKRKKLDKSPNIPNDKTKIPPESNLRVISNMSDLYTQPTEEDKSQNEGSASEQEIISLAPQEVGGGGGNTGKGPSSKQDKTIWERLSFLNRLERTSCVVQVPGDSNLRVGDVVLFQIPRMQSKATTVKEYDSLLQNRWLVSSIHHNIDIENGYRQSVELVKDSLYTQLPQTKLLEWIRYALKLLSGVLGAFGIIGGNKFIGSGR